MNATGALPIEGGSSVADHCKKRIREIYADCFAPSRPRVDRGKALWTLLTERERAFICKAAKVDGALIASPWHELPELVQTDVLAAWRRLVDFVGRVEANLNAVSRR